MRSGSARISMYIIALLLLVAIGGDFIANDRPIYCNIDGVSYYPVLNSYGQAMGLTKAHRPSFGKDWHEEDYDKVLWPIIPFSGSTLDIANPFSPPFSGAKLNNRFKHLLGTGQLGKDVAAGIVEGTRIALLVGILSILFAMIIGLIIGCIAGFF